MIRRAFIRRMMGAALASGLLGSELLARQVHQPKMVTVSVSVLREGMASVMRGSYGPTEIHMHPADFAAILEDELNAGADRIVERWGDDLVKGSGGSPRGFLQ